MLTGGGGKICQNLADVICERSLSNQLSIQYDKMTILFTVIITDIDENQVNTKKRVAMSNFNRFYQDLYRILWKIPKFCGRPHFPIPMSASVRF